MRSRSPAEITSYPIPEKLLSPTLAVSLSQRINHNTDFLNPNKHGNESNRIDLKVLCQDPYLLVIFKDVDAKSGRSCFTLSNFDQTDFAQHWHSGTRFCLRHLSLFSFSSTRILSVFEIVPNK